MRIKEKEKRNSSNYDDIVTIIAKENVNKKKNNDADRFLSNKT